MSLEPLAKINDRFSIFLNSEYRQSECDIFYKTEFYNLHRKSFNNFFSFQLVDIHRKESYGSTHFAETSPGQFRSPGYGSYGGFHFHSSISMEEQYHFVEMVLKFLEDHHAKTIQIILPPYEYSPTSASMITNICFRLGFQIKKADLNFSIKVDGGDFRDKIDSGNRKQLKKCEIQNILTKELSPEDYKNAYDVICINRAHRGFPITMSWDAILNMVNTFPDKMHFYGSFYDNQLIASSICIDINSSVLYVFYWGDLPGQNNYSPITHLANFLYEQCMQNNKRILDIGTSTVDSIPNAGLVRYKLHLGCKPYLKTTLYRSKNE